MDPEPDGVRAVTHLQVLVVILGYLALVSLVVYVWNKFSNHEDFWGD